MSMKKILTLSSLVLLAGTTYAQMPEVALHKVKNEITVIGDSARLINADKTASRRNKHAQYPFLLSDAFVGASVGYINYPFSEQQLQSGYHVGSVRVPHTAVRLTLLGHQFNQYLSAQITYMRPVSWVEYKSIKGDNRTYSVWFNNGGLTLKAVLPFSKKFFVYGEGGLGVITRSGFKINHEPVVKDANFATVLAGGGLQYRMNNKWDFLLNATYAPAQSKTKQPSTLFIGGGFSYNMHALPETRIDAVTKAGYWFPDQLFQVGYSTNTFGYNVNDYVSGKVLPIFWGGDANVKHGIVAHYQRNVFHTRKVFSLDIGASLSYWSSKKEGNNFYTASVYPLLRFTALRIRPFDLYFNYSVAGPSYISKVVIDSSETGKHFTFQDFMGMGIFAGKNRHLNAEIKIQHYSNGNIFPRNAGVKVPLTFNLGYAF